MDSLFDFKDIKKLIRLAESLDEKGLHKEADGIEESISSVMGYGKGGGGLKKFSDDKAAAEKALAAAKETAAKAIAGAKAAVSAAGKAGGAAGRSNYYGKSYITDPLTGERYGTQKGGLSSVLGDVGRSLTGYDDWRIPRERLQSIAPQVLSFMIGKGYNYKEYDFFIQGNAIYTQPWFSSSGALMIPLAVPTQEKEKVNQEGWKNQILSILKDQESGASYKAGVSSIIQLIEGQQITQAPTAAQTGTESTTPTGTGTGTGGRGRGGGRTGTGRGGRPGTAGGETPEQPPTSTGIITKTLSDGSILYYKMGPRRRYIGVIDYDPDGSKGLGPQRSTRYVFYNTETKAIQESTFRFPMTNDEKAQVDQIKKNVVDRKRAERAARRETARQTNIQQNQTARTQAQTARQTGRTERQEVNQAARTERQDANQAGRAAKKEENQAQRDARQEANQAKRTTRQQENQAQRDARQAANQAKRRRG